MVTIRKTTAKVEAVQTVSRLQKHKNRQSFLKRTEGKVWDEETSQFVENDNYNKSTLELAGDSVIAENEYWDTLARGLRASARARDRQVMEDHSNG